MGYNKNNFKRIREEYETKAFRAEEEADARREEVYAALPEMRELDARLSQFGLRIMKAALSGENTEERVAALREENERIRLLRTRLLEKNGFPADYCDPRYACEQCKDTGYCGIRMCSCMRRSLIKAGMESSGLSALMEQQSFENFSLKYYSANPEELRRMTDTLTKLKSYAHGFSIEADQPMPKSWLFLGGTGLGKTHLSTSIAKVVIERGYDVYYNSAVGMISDFESKRFGNGMAATGSDDTARYIDCDLLIIDDLGTEVVNQFTVSCLYYVLNTRLNLRRPMIISTNLLPAELRKVYSDRIFSRLTGEFQIAPFYGTDIRKQRLND